MSSLKPLSFNFKAVDVLSLSIINTQHTAMDVYLSGTIKNRSSDMVISFTSKSFRISSGNNIVSSNTTQVSFEFNSTAKRFNITQFSALPYGKYEVEVTLNSSSMQESVFILDFEQEILPLSPPMLISPEDEAFINTRFPLLIWSPPLPISNFQILYGIRIVEILPNQTAGDAIQKNFAVYEQKNLTNISLQYPANALPLDPKKKYAWQVQAATEDFFIGFTEIFSFGFPQDVAPVTSIIYGIMKKEIDAGFYIATDMRVYFNFKEDYAKNNLNFRIINDKGENIRKACSLEIKKQPGENQFMLDLTLCDKMKEGFYILEVLSEKNELYKIKFKIQ